MPASAHLGHIAICGGMHVNQQPLQDDPADSSESTSIASAVSNSRLISSMPPYGSFPLIHRPQRTSTLQSPDAVADANMLVLARPLTLFQVTRCTPTSLGQAPVPIGCIFVGSFDFPLLILAARVAAGRSCVSWILLISETLGLAKTSFYLWEEPF